MRASNAATEEVGSAALRKQLVVVVDDEPDIRDSLTQLLNQSLSFARAQPSASAAEALELLGREQADLVVADYRMPGMNGIEFLAEARHLAPNAAFVIVTAYADLDLALRAINESRVVRFFPKPLDSQRFVSAVREILFDLRLEELRNRAFARSIATHG